MLEYLLHHEPSTMLSFHSHIVRATLRLQYNKYCFPYFRDTETEAQSYEMTGTNHTAIEGQNQNYKTGLDFNLGRRRNLDN